VLGVAEIAAFCNVRPPNVRKMLDRHGIKPHAQLTTGPVFKKVAVEKMQAARLEDKAAREADERRQASALR
jgi:hypothetical protein